MRYIFANNTKICGSFQFKVYFEFSLLFLLWHLHKYISEKQCSSKHLCFRLFPCFLIISPGKRGGRIFPFVGSTELSPEFIGRGGATSLWAATSPDYSPLGGKKLSTENPDLFKYCDPAHPRTPKTPRHQNPRSWDPTKGLWQLVWSQFTFETGTDKLMN